MEISKDLLELLLPSFIVNHFTFIRSNSSEECLHLHFEEKNDETLFKDSEFESKGYHKEIISEDFLLRGKLVYLYIKRRRWTDLDTQEILQRDLNTIAKGTRMTEGFF